MDNLDLKELRRLAEKATQERWSVKYFGSKVGFRFSSGYQFFIDLRRPNQACSDEAKATAEFLEMLDPPTVRSLLDRLERAEKDAERYRILRDFSAGQWEHPIVVEQKIMFGHMTYHGPLAQEALDKAIDKARAEQEGK